MGSQFGAGLRMQKQLHAKTALVVGDAGSHQKVAVGHLIITDKEDVKTLRHSHLN